MNDSQSSPTNSSHSQSLRSHATTPPSENRTCPCKKLPLALSSFTAAEYGDLHSLQRKWKASSDEDNLTSHPALSPPTDTGGYTALHLAAQHNQVAATNFLLQQHCPVEGRNIQPTCVASDWATPLHRASFAGATATMQLLLDHGANVLAIDGSFGDGRMPLHKAAAGGRYLAIQLLLEALQQTQLRSALPQALSANDKQGLTPLQVAQQLQERQEEERASVARWDQIAGGQADWNKCVLLLQRAEHAIKLQQQNDQATTASAATSISESSLCLPPAMLPTSNEHGCWDCTSADGTCLTASWQAAFEIALGKSVEDIVSNAHRPEPKLPRKTNVLQEEMASLPPSSPINEDEFILNSPSAEVESRTKRLGAKCAVCGQHTVALFSSKWGLICKLCRYRIR